MVKNEHGGNKHKKFGRRKTRVEALDKIENDQMFAKIIKNEGDHFSVLCSDNMIRKGRMSGKLKKGPRLIAGSFVVISTREFESDKKNCDIIGIGNPPSNIINLFNKNSGDKTNDNINFVESDDEFNDFQDTKKDNDDNQDEKDEDDEFLWDDIDNI